ncbi:hypothetical protein HYX08_00865 [Candidatus Woesearchaeota archaeon]|nr:hypothetical protein [Candidatus Woesearchaeota archaeon]
MIKVKKLFSLLIIFSVILSNAVFAQLGSSSPYEGRPIDPSREGKDYYREGDVVVYPNEMGSKEMERFIKGGASEEEMRKMAKAKFGSSFDEMEFEKGMMESKERMQRKDALSYENEWLGQRYYIGPSYEGYSEEQIVFGMVFQHIGDDIDPREIKQYCSDPEKIAGIVIAKFREKVGDLQSVCRQAADEESKCHESAKTMCSQIGTPYSREGATELEKLQAAAHSCPVNKEAIIKACKLRSKSNMEQQARQNEESCEKRFEYEGERLLEECGRFKENQVCDREKYIDRCMGGMKKEEFERPVCPPAPIPECRGTLQKKTDDKGCVNYYCATIVSECPPSVEPVCGEGYTLQKKADEKGCVSYHCEQNIASACPPQDAPTCASGQSLQKKSDDRGCVYYYCERIPCNEVPKPSCNADEQIQAYYDNAGCTTSYQCTKTQTACPAVEKPACAQGQSLTAKNDERGCVAGYECVNAATTGSVIKITGNVAAGAYDDRLRQCGDSWRQQEKSCASMQESCDKNAMIERCREQSRRNFEEYGAKIDQNCELLTSSEIKSSEDRCSRMDKEKERCSAESAKRCEHMKGIAEKCKETLTDENLRKFIIGEAKKKCKFKDIVREDEDVRASEKAEIVLAVLNTAAEDDIEKLGLFVDDLKEDLKLQDTTVYKGMINPNNFGDIKLLPFVVNAKLSSAASSERAREVKSKLVSGAKAEEAAGKLASLRDSDVPSEYLYIIEDKASEVLDVSDKLEEIEQKEGQKGVGYKVKLFLGLAKAAEQEEIRQLDESREKLSKSIEALAKLIDEVPSDVAKSILREQVENLKKQQEDISALAETKEKKAKGWFGLFG